MRIAVVGGTGRTGALVVKRAAAAGHDVRVLARRPAEARRRFEDLPPGRVDVREGDLRDAASVAAWLAPGGGPGSGADGGPVDAVLSAAGPVRGGGAHDLRDGATHVLDAVRRHGIDRLVWMTGAGVRFPEDRPGAVDRLVVGLMGVVARRTLADSRDAVGVVTSSTLEWTVVRAPRLTDGPASAEPTVAPGVGHGGGITASRATLARVLLEVVEQGSWVRQGPVVSD